MGKEKKETTFEEFRELTRQYCRKEVLACIRAGIMKNCPEAERDEVYRELFALRDIEIAGALAKLDAPFKPEYLKMDYVNWNNCQFVQDVLQKYKKKFDMKDDAVSGEIFDIACETRAKQILEDFIRHKKMVRKYPLLAASSDAVFQLIRHFDSHILEKDERVEMYFFAAVAADGTSRLTKLAEWGYDLGERNSDGKSVQNLLEERLRTYSYPKNRSGDLMRKKERAAMQAIPRIQNPVESEEDGGLVGEGGIRRPLGLLLVILCVGVITYGIGYAAFDSDGTDSAAEETTDETGEETTDDGTDDETDETTDDETTDETDEETTDDETDEDTEEATDDETDEASEEYSTDSSLTVEDGDTVNIDYTGSIDGEEFSGGSTDGAGTDLVIGSDSYIDDFEDQLIGCHPGDTTTVEVTFPDSYGNEDLAGKDAVFEVTINGIYK